MRETPRSRGWQDTVIGWAIVSIAFIGVFTLVRAAAAQNHDEEAYLSQCGGCHGPDGEGTEWAPSIIDEGAAGADFMMRTGRMPLRQPEDPIRRGPPRLTDDQIELISGYVSGFGGPPIPSPRPEQGELGLGAEIYLANCAACHGATGVGAALPRGLNAPSVFGADSLDVAEAVRSGPLAMPSYGAESIDDHQLNSLVAYVTTLAESQNVGGWSLGRWGPVPEGATAWLVAIVAVIFVAAWIEGATGRGEDK